MVISSARAAVAANIVPTAKQITLLALILIPFRSARLENLTGPIKFINGKIDIVMSHQPTESKRLLSYVIAEWACSLKYEHLSPEAIQAAKLFWFDSIGCALTRNLCCRRVLIRPRNPAAAGDWHTPLYEFGV